MHNTKDKEDVTEDVEVWGVEEVLDPGQMRATLCASFGLTPESVDGLVKSPQCCGIPIAGIDARKNVVLINFFPLLTQAPRRAQ